MRCTRAQIAGDFDGAERLAQETLELGQRGQAENATNYYAMALFNIRREQGRLAELEGAVRRFIELYPAIPAWRCTLALLLVELGRPDEARAVFEALAGAGFDALPRDANWLIAVTLLAEVCGALGDAERAPELHRMLEPYAGRNVIVGRAATCNGAAARLLGILAGDTWATGTRPRACFDEADALHAAMGARPWIAHTHLARGAMLLARGERPTASACAGCWRTPSCSLTRSAWSRSPPARATWWRRPARSPRPPRGSLHGPMRLAVQLYTLRDALQADLETTLAALADAGGKDVELAGFYGRTPTEMRAALDAAGLTAISGHVALDAFESGAERVVAAARTLGTGTVVVPSVPAPATAAEADATVERIRAAHRVATEAGLGFAYHNHDFEFRPLDDGSDLWSRLVAAEPHRTSRTSAGSMVAGRDPVAVLGELEGRCPLVHAKDVRQQRRRHVGGRDRGRRRRSDWAGDRARGRRSRPVRRGWWSSSTTRPRTPVDDVALSLAALRDALAVTDARRRRDRLRHDQRRVPAQRRPPRRRRLRRLRRRRSGRRGACRARVRPRRVRRGRAAGTRRRRRGALPHAARLARRGRAEGDRRGQARVHREAAGQRAWKTAACWTPQRRPACGSAARPTRSSARGSRRCARRSRPGAIGAPALVGTACWPARPSAGTRRPAFLYAELAGPLFDLGPYAVGDRGRARRGE